MGAWIEITTKPTTHYSFYVASYMGAWIEIYSVDVVFYITTSSHPIWVRGLKCYCYSFVTSTFKSHPIWVRGLKFLWQALLYLQRRRILYGCVDWNNDEIRRYFCFILVASYMGAWIEIETVERCFLFRVSRILYGCVDWNCHNPGHLPHYLESHPIWVRGLKYTH